MSTPEPTVVGATEAEWGQAYAYLYPAADAAARARVMFRELRAARGRPVVGSVTDVTSVVLLSYVDATCRARVLDMARRVGGINALVAEDARLRAGGALRRAPATPPLAP